MFDMLHTDMARLNRYPDSPLSPFHLVLSLFLDPCMSKRWDDPLREGAWPSRTSISETNVLIIAL